MTGDSGSTAMDIGFSIDHTALSVSNLDISMKFYTDVLGFTCERIIDIPGGNIALLRKSDFTIEMFRFNDAIPRPEGSSTLLNDLKTIGVKHLALRVKDIHAAAAFLKENGVEFINEPVKGSRGFYRFFIKDPDGMPVELTEGPATGS